MATAQIIAGTTVNEAVSRAEELEQRNINPIVNQLGEHYQRTVPVKETVREYETLIEELNASHITASLALKPTQLGLAVKKQLFRENIKRIVEKASKNNIFVWIDTESTETINDALDVYQSVSAQYPNNIGISLQANLKRTQADIESLYDMRANVRLIDYTYTEHETVVIPDKERVVQNYVKLIQSSAPHLRSLSICSDRKRVIEIAKKQSEQSQTDIEIQTSENTKYQEELVSEGYAVSQYVPYGDEWFSYMVRQTRDNPRNIVPFSLLLFHSLKQKVLPRN